jgi:hypothetical protein
MSMIMMKTIRAMIATTLIVGSLYVHVAGAQRSGSKYADLQRSSSPGSVLAMYIAERGKPVLTMEMNSDVARERKPRLATANGS